MKVVGLIWTPLLACALCAGQDSGTSAPSQSPIAPAGSGVILQQAPGLGQQGIGQIPGAQGLPGAQQLGVTPSASDLANRMLGINTPNAEDQQLNPDKQRLVRPVYLKTEFQTFAEEAVGHPLDVFGRTLFDESLSTFAPLSNIPVPADYVIGPGDELLIRLWGKIDMDQQFIVDRNGQVALPRVGTITVSGLRYQDLQGFLHAQVAKIYKDFEINVTLGKLRSIQVYVLGNAVQPGSYTLSSLSSLMDALFASGGPAANGSMRRIELRRDGQTVTVFDIYDVQQKGDKSHDVKLLPGDVIYIPPIGPQVAIDGSINAPGIYELKDSETLSALLEGAGGLTGLASTDQLLLERIQDRRRRIVETFSLTEEARQRPLRDGDILRISPLMPKFVGEVTLRGNVASPGRYAWHSGMRISDVIPNRQVLITRDHWVQHNHLADQQNLSANVSAVANDQSLSNQLQQDQQIAGNNAGGNSPQLQRSLQSAQNALAQNATANGGTANSLAPANGQGDLSAPAYVRPTIDIMDDLNRTNAEINWDYAVIERLDPADLKTHLIPFNLASAIDHPDSVDNQLLQSGDVVIILSKDDIGMPMDKQTIFVSVGGEVNVPGIYRMKPGETLRDVIRRAGGLTPHSYLYGAQFNRVSTKKIQQQDMALSLQRMRNELAYSRLNSSQGALAASGSETSVTGLAMSQQMQQSADQNLLSQLASIQPTGRIVLGIDPKASQIDELPNISLEDGDTIIIPRDIGTVQVSGEVYNPSSLLYRSERRLKQYLDDAGGPTRVADEKRIFLIRADGTVVSKQAHRRYASRGFSGLELMPGDAIVVPPQIKERGQFWNNMPMITTLLSQTAMMGSVIALLNNK